MYVPIKYYQIIQTVWELWPAQGFRFRGDKYIMKKVKIVSLAHGTSSGPYLCLYPILSKHFKPLRSYGVGLEICSGEITRKNNKARVVLLAKDTST